MKILQVNSVYNYGSTGKIVKALHEVIKSTGNESFVIYGRGKKCTDQSVIKVGNIVSQILHVCLSRFFDLHGKGSIIDTLLILSKIDKIKPDIVHIHNVHGYYLNIDLLFRYLEKHKTKVVWTLHDCWAFTGHCAYFETIKCTKWQDSCSKCDLRGDYPKSFCFDNSKNNFKNKKRLFKSLDHNLTIISPSIWLSKYVEKSFLHNITTYKINNGINLNVFKYTESDYKEKLGLLGKKIILGVANKWDKRKGLDLFVSLSNLLSENEVIVLIGLDENQIKKLPEKIIGIKKTKNQVELAKYYSMADVFLNPSQEDNYPTTNLEAQACGIPVLTTNVGGSAETLQNKNSRVTNSTNVVEIYETLKLMNNFKQRVELLNTNLDENIAHREYVRIYEKIYNT